MGTLSMKDVLDRLLFVFKEALEGNDPANFFLDNGSRFSLLGTLRGLNSARASQPSGGKSEIYGATATGPKQASIAAHVHHVVFGQEMLVGWIQGERKEIDWDLGWTVSVVNEAEWAALLERLERSYVELKAVIERHGADNIDSLDGVLSAISHAAYHLGRIQEKLDGMG